MHLGVNLRHAHVKAMSAVTSIQDDNDSDSQDDSSDHASADSKGSSDDETESRMCTSRRHNDLDVFVHETCKVFDHLGTPEYCHGASTF